MADANQSWSLLCAELGVLVNAKPTETDIPDVQTKWALEIEEQMVSRGAPFLPCDRYIQ
jgi:hypothetical protein